MAAIREPVGLPPAEPRVQLLADEPHKRVSTWTAAVAVLAVVVALALFGFQFVGTDSLATPTPSAVAAGGMAATAVATYLGGPEADRIAIFGAVAPLDSSFYVAGARTVMLDEGADRWRATVAIDLLTRADSGFRPAGLHFYQIALVPTDQGWRVQGPPGLVGGPIAPPDAIAWDSDLDQTVAEVIDTKLVSLADDVAVTRTADLGTHSLVEISAEIGGHRQMLVYEVRTENGHLVITGVG